jgi:RNA polymerase sigma-70 factor, ECF subfamily
MNLKNLLQNSKQDTGQSDLAFSELYDRTFDKVYGFLIARLSGDTHTAADLTQDTFLAVYRSMRNFSGRSAESTWVIGIAKNKLYDYYRGCFRRKNWLESLEDAEPIDDSMEDIIISAENTEFVRKVLNSLPEQYRMLLILKYMENLKLRDIAPLTGRTVKSIDGLIQRAKATFIKAYREVESGGYDDEKRK